MKNYELIAELSKYPAGHEVVFDSIVKKDDEISSLDAEMAQVTHTILDVEVEDDRIILC